MLKMLNSRVLIPFIFLLTGFVSAYLFINYTSEDKPLSSDDETIVPVENADNNSTSYTPNTYPAMQGSRLSRLENELEQLKQQMQQVNQTLESLLEDNTPAPPILTGRKNTTLTPSILTRRLYSYESLIRGGIDQVTAEDIVRRKNNFELQRLALQDRATRENYLNTQQYYDELDAINQNDVSLRDELGDDRYDEYLFTSKLRKKSASKKMMWY